MEPQMINKKWNLFDAFVLLMVVLAGAAVYFTLVHPIQFSNQIKREEIPHYVDLLLVLPSDFGWAKDALPEHLEKKDIYNRTEWKILDFEEKVTENGKWPAVRIKLKVSETGKGEFHYGHYPILRGGHLLVTYGDYAIEGRIYEFQVLPEEVSL